MRTAGTIDRYRKEGARLFRTYRNESGGEPEGFVEWLASQKGKLRKNTWYLYKQAGLQLLSDLGRADDVRKLEREGSDGCRAGHETLRRGVSDRDIGRLWNASRESSARIRAWVWVVAGRATGL